MHYRLIVHTIIALIVGLGALTFAPSGVKAAPKHPLILDAIHQTQLVIQHAIKVVKEGGQGKPYLHQAILDQRAARWCLNHDRPEEALRLTLRARAEARMAILANQG
jgi:hypothetical protein